MLRKHLIIGLGLLGLVLTGTVAGSQPASAGYACGYWNGWCGAYYYLYPGWRWNFGWYGDNYHHHYNHNNWGNSHGHANWDHDRDNDWHGNNYQAYKNHNWNNYH